jgi:hypothetical protein
MNSDEVQAAMRDFELSDDERDLALAKIAESGFTLEELLDIAVHPPGTSDTGIAVAASLAFTVIRLRECGWRVERAQ